MLSILEKNVPELFKVILNIKTGQIVEVKINLYLKTKMVQDS